MALLWPMWRCAFSGLADWRHAAVLMQGRALAALQPGLGFPRHETTL